MAREDERDFWAHLDRLVAGREVIVDRPRGAPHPRFPDVVYPLDYGYLAGTRGSDGAAVDVFLGGRGGGPLVGVYCTVDLGKRDVEVKLLLGCSDEEVEEIGRFLGRHTMRALLVRR